MDGDKTDQGMRVVLVKLERGKGSVKIPKALFLLYFENAPLIQLTRTVTLRDWPKLEGLSGVMVEKFIRADSRLYWGMDLVKEGKVLLKGGE